MPRSKIRLMVALNRFETAIAAEARKLVPSSERLGRLKQHRPVVKNRLQMQAI
jgi:hypothetical protein